MPKQCNTKCKYRLIGVSRVLSWHAIIQSFVEFNDNPLKWYGSWYEFTCIHCGHECTVRKDDFFKTEVLP